MNVISSTVPSDPSAGPGSPSETSAPFVDFANDTRFFGHPRPLVTLFFTEFGERFSYYGMRAILLLFLVAPAATGGMGLTNEIGASIYALYTGSVYLASIPGGWIADRLLGLRRAVLVGGILIAAGHYTLALPWRNTFFVGLALIVFGTGLLKPNMSSLVGQLYGPGDGRRDAGFSIFYMGINLGAFLSPFVCGWLGQRVGWHWGFASAGVAMTLGLVFYLADQRRLGRVGLLAEPPRNAGGQWLAIVCAVLALVLVFYVIWPYRHYVMILGAVAVFAYLLKRGGETPMERKRIGAVALLFIFATLFWAGFEQAGSSLTLFADQVTRNQVFGWEFPSSWYQFVEPMFVILLAPVMALLWLRLGRRDPSSPTKFLISLVLLALSFGVVALASQYFAQSGEKVSPWWLVLVYLLHAIGELSLSPVGLSSTTKLAPAKIVGFVMGVWFLSNSLGNFFAGEAAAYFDKVPLPRLFGTMGLMVAAAAVVLLLLVRPIRNLMSGIN